MKLFRSAFWMWDAFCFVQDEAPAYVGYVGRIDAGAPTNELLTQAKSLGFALRDIPKAGRRVRREDLHGKGGCSNNDRRPNHLWC